MTTTALNVCGLTFGVQPHFWMPQFDILKSVSFHVHKGEIFGFLGPNGAGKTTTIKAILGLLTPKAGRVEVLGGSMAQATTRSKVGFMPERAIFPAHLTGFEWVMHHARLAGLKKGEARLASAQVLEQVELTDAMNRRIGTYSKGMVQRAGLAQALVANPDLLILDEPMSGLDPLGRHLIRNILEKLRDQGKTVFFSTHILPDVEQICDRVAILEGGKIRKEGPLGELLESRVEQMEFHTSQIDTHCEKALTAFELTVVKRAGNHRLMLQDPGFTNQVIDTLRSHEVAILEMTAHRASLEDLFLENMDTATQESAP